VHKWRGRGIVLGVLSLALIAAACGSSSKKSSSGSTSSTASGAVKQGGDLTFSAEQEPDCMDWIGSCAGAAWGVYTVQTNTMPRAYDFSDTKGYVPSNLLTGPADVKSNPEVVTYHINPKAVWSDGQPITSADFQYTWDQIAHGQNIYDTTGYAQISSVGTPDPQTAVVTYSSPFANWKSLFGSFYGVLPSHILKGQDRDTAMKNGYTFSGGPWMMPPGGWVKGQSVKLVPNPNYWGTKPNLSSVTFDFITDTATEQQDFKSGQVVAAYPQAQPGQEALKGTPGTYFDAVSGLSFEGLWYNVEKAPLNDQAVREALGYAVDRNAIVNQLFAPIQPGIQPIQSIMTPAFGAAYTTPFTKYHLDLSKVTQIMTGDGWTKGANGIWTKGGTPAALELKTTTGNKRRQLTAQILQTELQSAGFQLTVTPEKAGVLFGQDLPAGNYQIGLYAQTPSDNDPGTAGCVFWCSKNVPSASNGNNGENFNRIANPTLDKPMLDMDTNLDQAARIADSHQGQALLANLIPTLPIDPFPDIVVVNSDKVGVAGGTFQHNFAYGPFTYMNTWYAK
jgi:peptide/nickel transport system substrate-binding protein